MIKFFQLFHKIKTNVLLKLHIKNKYCVYFTRLFEASAMMEPTEGSNSKIKNPVQDVPLKRIKLNVLEIDTLMQRTVGTMCGAWRPDEVDGGLVLVFKSRDPGLSPDPTREEDYPENIKDFWEDALSADELQVSGILFLSLTFNRLLLV